MIAILINRSRRFFKENKPLSSFSVTFFWYYSYHKYIDSLFQLFFTNIPIFVFFLQHFYLIIIFVHCLQCHQSGTECSVFRIRIRIVNIKGGRGAFYVKEIAILNPFSKTFQIWWNLMLMDLRMQSYAKTLSLIHFAFNPANLVAVKKRNFVVVHIAFIFFG